MLPTPSRALSALALASVLLGAASGPRLVPLFEATFDQQLSAEIGTLTGAQGEPAVTLVSGPSGGGALRIDDTGLGPSAVEIRAHFPDGQEVSSGRIVATWTMVFGQDDGVFLAGGAGPSPNDALIPVGGSDGTGTICVAGKSTGQSVPVDEPVDVVLVFERSNPHEDWSFTFSLAPQAQGGETPLAATGVLAGTADQPLGSIVFWESAATSGTYLLDDISVGLETP